MRTRTWHYTCNIFISRDTCVDSALVSQNFPRDLYFNRRRPLVTWPGAKFKRFRKRGPLVWGRERETQEFLVPNSRLRRHLKLATAFFYCALTAAGLARADEADDLTTAVVMHIRQHS